MSIPYGNQRVTDGPNGTNLMATGLWYKVPHFCHRFHAYSFHLQVVCTWRYLGIVLFESVFSALKMFVWCELVSWVLIHPQQDPFCWICWIQSKRHQRVVRMDFHWENCRLGYDQCVSVFYSLFSTSLLKHYLLTCLTLVNALHICLPD